MTTFTVCSLGPNPNVQALHYLIAFAIHFKAHHEPFCILFSFYAL